MYFFSLSAEEQDHQARGEEAAEGGSKEVNYHTINLLFNCSTVFLSGLFFLLYLHEKIVADFFLMIIPDTKTLSGVFSRSNHDEWQSVNL